MQLTIKSVVPAVGKNNKTYQKVTDSNGVQYTTFDDFLPYQGQAVEVEVVEKVVGDKVYKNLSLPKETKSPAQNAAPSKDVEIRRASASLGLEAASLVGPTLENAVSLTKKYEAYLRTGEFPG